MDWKPVIKLLLGFGVQLLGKAIPWLGTLLGGPLGFVASWAVSYLTGLLLDWVDRLQRYGAIDAEVQKDVVAMKDAQAALVVAQDKPTTTEAEHAKAIADFTAAARKLGTIKLQR